MSNLNQTQKYSMGDLRNLKIILSMTNNSPSLEFSPITCNLPSLLMNTIPTYILSVLAKWSLVSDGPLLKVCIFV